MVIFSTIFSERTWEWRWGN